MKHKLRTILLVVVLMFSFMLNVNADTTIKEDASAYTGDVYIIGSSRFDSSVIVTGTMATVAGARELQIQYMIHGNYEFNPEDIRIYYYSELEETWSVLPVTSEDELTELTEEETEELTENLNIYYVNEEEKMLEMTYEVNLEDSYELEFLAHNETYSNKIKYEDGKLIIPASVGWFEIYAVKEPTSESEEPEELYLGNVEQEEGEFNVFSSVVRNYQDLLAAINYGAEWIGIEESIDLPTALEITRPVEIYIDYDAELTVKEDTAGDGVFHVLEGGDLYIYGDGKINGVGNNKWNIVIFAEGGRVTLNGGIYTNIDATIMEDDTDSDHFDVIYAKGDAEVIINGGYFEGKTPAWILNLHDGSRETASITVYGGTFAGFNPADNAAEGAHTSFLAEGYKVYPYNGEYTVSEIDEYDVAIVNNVAYTSLQAAVDYAPEGATINLLQDIDLPTAVEVSKEVTLELSGYNLTITKDTVGDGVFYVPEGGKLTINGEGTINGLGNNDYSMAIWANGGEVIINGGTYTNVGAGEDEHYDLIYAKNGGKVIINGGTFEAHTPKWTLNLKDTDGSSIVVKGGTFKNYNPAEVYTEPTQPLNFVADGYKSVGNNGEYTVVPYNAENVTDEKELRSLMTKNGTITLGANIDLETAVHVTGEVVLELNGHNLTVTEDTVGDGVFYVPEGGKLTINGEGTINGLGNNDYSMAIWANGGEVIINGGTYTNVGAGDEDHYDLIYAKNGGKVTINGGTFEAHTPKWTLNLKDTDGSSIIVKGGTFKNYNPAEVYTEPTQPLNFVAEGYKSVESNGDYTVIAE